MTDITKQLAEELEHGERLADRVAKTNKLLSIEVACAFNSIATLARTAIAASESAAAQPPSGGEGV